jgi:hypothetical protein
MQCVGKYSKYSDPCDDADLVTWQPSSVSVAQGLQALEMTYNGKRYSLLFVRWLSDVNAESTEQMSEEELAERGRKPTSTTYEWSEAEKTAGPTAGMRTWRNAGVVGAFYDVVPVSRRSWDKRDTPLSDESVRS